MKVLITGGAGFIGSHLAEALLEEGNDVFIIDNLSTGRLDNVPEKAIFLETDIQRENHIGTYFSSFKPDVVVHAAASYKDPTDWREDTVTNVLGTVNIVKQCLKHDVKRIIYLQTSLCYGPPQEQPITLRHPLMPQNSYAITKTAAERYIRMSGLDYISFRLANCYGPRNLSGPIPTFFKKLNEGKNCTIMRTRRDFVYVDDLVRLLLMAIDGKGSGVYHISSGRDYSIEDVYWEIYEAMGSELVGKTSPNFIQKGADDVETILLDPSRTKREFGSVEIPLSYGIGEAIKWYGSHNVDKVYTHLKEINDD